MEDNHANVREVLADFLLCLTTLITPLVLVILLFYFFELDNDLSKTQNELEQQEQVEEGTITCPRCLKQFDVENQAPDYKKPQRRPAPCGTNR